MKKYLAIAAAGGALAIGVPAAFAATDAPEHAQHARPGRDADAGSAAPGPSRTARRRTAAAAAAATNSSTSTEI